MCESNDFVDLETESESIVKLLESNNELNSMATHQFNVKNTYLLYTMSNS